jgi:hypothetical protein
MQSSEKRKIMRDVSYFEILQFLYILNFENINMYKAGYFRKK